MPVKVCGCEFMVRESVCVVPEPAPSVVPLTETVWLWSPTAEIDAFWWGIPAPPENSPAPPEAWIDVPVLRL